MVFKRVPPQIMTLIAVVSFLAWFGFSPSFRQFVHSLDTRMLTTLQSWRIGGCMFVVGGVYAFLPGAFAWPAGWGDIAVGVTAPFVAKYLMKPEHRRIFAAWQVLGALELVMAVTLAILTSPRVHMLGNALNSEQLNVLPLSIVPLFVVPMAAVFHIICVAQALRWERPSGSAHASPNPLPPSRY
jgi:hypothetical protein